MFSCFGLNPMDCAHGDEKMIAKENNGSSRRSLSTDFGLNSDFGKWKPGLRYVEMKKQKMYVSPSMSGFQGNSAITCESTNNPYALFDEETSTPDKRASANDRIDIDSEIFQSPCSVENLYSGREFSHLSRDSTPKSKAQQSNVEKQKLIVTENLNSGPDKETKFSRKTNKSHRKSFSNGNFSSFHAAEDMTREAKGVKSKLNDQRNGDSRSKNEYAQSRKKVETGSVSGEATTSSSTPNSNSYSSTSTSRPNPKRHSLSNSNFFILEDFQSMRLNEEVAFELHQSKQKDIPKHVEKNFERPLDETEPGRVVHSEASLESWLSEQKANEKKGRKKFSVSGDRINLLNRDDKSFELFPNEGCQAFINEGKEKLKKKENPKNINGDSLNGRSKGKKLSSGKLLFDEDECSLLWDGSQRFFVQRKDTKEVNSSLSFGNYSNEESSESNQVCSEMRSDNTFFKGTKTRYFDKEGINSSWIVEFSENADSISDTEVDKKSSIETEVHGKVSGMEINISASNDDLDDVDENDSLEVSPPKDLCDFSSVDSEDEMDRILNDAKAKKLLHGLDGKNEKALNPPDENDHSNQGGILEKGVGKLTEEKEDRNASVVPHEGNVKTEQMGSKEEGREKSKRLRDRIERVKQKDEGVRTVEDELSGTSARKSSPGNCQMNEKIVTRFEFPLNYFVDIGSATAKVDSKLTSLSSLKRSNACSDIDENNFQTAKKERKRSKSFSSIDVPFYGNENGLNLFPFELGKGLCTGTKRKGEEEENEGCTKKEEKIKRSKSLSSINELLLGIENELPFQSGIVLFSGSTSKVVKDDETGDKKSNKMGDMEEIKDGRYQGKDEEGNNVDDDNSDKDATLIDGYQECVNNKNDGKDASLNNEEVKQTKPRRQKVINANKIPSDFRGSSSKIGTSRIIEENNHANGCGDDDGLSAQVCDYECSVGDSSAKFSISLDGSTSFSENFSSNNLVNDKNESFVYHSNTSQNLAQLCDDHPDYSSEASSSSVTSNASDVYSLSSSFIMGARESHVYDDFHRSQAKTSSVVRKLHFSSDGKSDISSIDPDTQGTDLENKNIVSSSACKEQTTFSNKPTAQIETLFGDDKKINVDDRLVTIVDDTRKVGSVTGESIELNETHDEIMSVFLVKDLSIDGVTQDVLVPGKDGNMREEGKMQVEMEKNEKNRDDKVWEDNAKEGNSKDSGKNCTELEVETENKLEDENEKLVEVYSINENRDTMVDKSLPGRDDHSSRKTNFLHESVAKLNGGEDEIVDKMIDVESTIKTKIKPDIKSHDFKFEHYDYESMNFKAIRERIMMDYDDHVVRNSFNREIKKSYSPPESIRSNDFSDEFFSPEINFVTNKNFHFLKSPSPVKSSSGDQSFGQLEGFFYPSNSPSPDHFVHPGEENGTAKYLSPEKKNSLSHSNVSPQRNAVTPPPIPTHFSLNKPSLSRQNSTSPPPKSLSPHAHHGFPHPHSTNFQQRLSTSPPLPPLGLAFSRSVSQDSSQPVAYSAMLRQISPELNPWTSKFGSPRSVSPESGFALPPSMPTTSFDVISNLNREPSFRLPQPAHSSELLMSPNVSPTLPSGYVSRNNAPWADRKSFGSFDEAPTMSKPPELVFPSLYRWHPDGENEDDDIRSEKSSSSFESYLSMPISLQTQVYNSFVSQRVEDPSMPTMDAQRRQNRLPSQIKLSDKSSIGLNSMGLIGWRASDRQHISRTYQR